MEQHFMAKKKSIRNGTVARHVTVARQRHQPFTEGEKQALGWDEIPLCAKDLPTLLGWIKKRSILCAAKARGGNQDQAAGILLGTSSVGFACERAKRLGMNFRNSELE